MKYQVIKEPCVMEGKFWKLGDVIDRKKDAHVEAALHFRTIKPIKDEPTLSVPEATKAAPEVPKAKAKAVTQSHSQPTQ